MMTDAERRRTFTAWMEGHQGILRKIARAWAFTPEDREDLVQEMAIQVWHSVAGFRAGAAVSTWVYRVALFTAIAWHKRERRHADRRADLDDHHQAAPPPEHDPDGRRAWLRDQIARLEPIDRSLTLMLLDGFSYREMADMLGISESHVGVKIHRIKKRLAIQSREDQLHGA
jgi:RNA polymerase sigma-70 factor (ECF subfamily)